MFLRDMIIREDGIMPAYHMNKMHWITVRLDGTVPESKRMTRYISRYRMGHSCS